MYSSFWLCVSILTAVLLYPPAFSFEVPLSDTAVREAYFLGQRGDEKMARFLETYRRYLPAPKSGPHVCMVEVVTPFAEAVNVSRQRSIGYSAQQAKLDYLARGDSLRIGVHIWYTATYGPGFQLSNHLPGPTGTWKDFRVRLLQNGRSIESKGVRYEGTHLSMGGGRGGGGSRPTGFIIWITYNPLDLNSAGDAAVEVETPDGQHVSTTLDLASLR